MQQQHVINLADRRMRADLEYSPGRRPTSSAYFAMPVRYTGVAVSTVDAGIAIMLDENGVPEDYVIPGTDGLRDQVDRWVERAYAGDRVAVETLKGIAVCGMKEIRARRAAEGRA